MADDDFDAFFRASYAPLVRALAVAAADGQVAEDVVQDAFVQALRHWPKIRGYDRPEAWVRRVALNKLADRGRRHRRRDRAIERMGLAPPPAERKLADPDLATAIAALPEQQRRVVGLHYLLDLPIAEVADDLGIAPGTVKSHLAAARKTLSTVLEVVDD